MSRRVPALFLLLALALLVRVLVPGGWMPAASGGLAFVPCPSAGPMTAGAAHHGGKHEPAGHQSGKAAAECPFAPLLASGDLPGPVASLAAAVVGAGAAPALPPHAAPGRTAARQLPPATGPPVLT